MPLMFLVRQGKHFTVYEYSEQYRTLAKAAEFDAKTQDATINVIKRARNKRPDERTKLDSLVAQCEPVRGMI